MLVGVVVSFYLFWESQTPDPSYACPTTGVFDCGAVARSGFSTLLGIPLSLIGLIYFIVQASLAFLGRKEVLYLSVIALPFVGYLVFTEVVLLHKVCIYCTTAQILGLTPILLMRGDKH